MNTKIKFPAMAVIILSLICTNAFAIVHTVKVVDEFEIGIPGINIEIQYWDAVLGWQTVFRVTNENGECWTDDIEIDAAATYWKATRLDTWESQTPEYPVVYCRFPEE